MGQVVSELWKTLWNMRNTEREYGFDINGVWYGSENEVEHNADSALFEEFGIGNAYIASLSLGLYADDIPKGAEIKRYVRLVNGDQGSEWLPKGVFYANRREVDEDYWRVSALDGMRKAEIVWEPDQTLEFPLAMSAAVTELAQIMGVELDERNEISGEYTIDYPANDYTIRNILAFIAAAHGGNFVITESGKLRLVPLLSAPEESSHLVTERGAAILIGGAAISVNGSGAETLTGDEQSALDKYYVGADLVEFSNNGRYKPISRVTLMLDDSNEITAGDDTGFEIVATCPYATQEMVDALLEKLRGYVYQAFEAEEANLNPSAELGDGVTVGGFYGVISKLRDDGSGYVGISAPGKAELEDDYPAEGPMSQMINRQLADVRSSISKTAEQIRAEVFGEDGYTGTSLAVQLGEIAGEVKGKINGEDAETLIKAALEKIELSISSDEGATTFTLNGGGAELTSKKFNLHVKAVNIHGKLTADQIETDELKVNAANITGSLTIGQLPSTVAQKSDIPNVSNFLTSSDLGENGTTTIYGGLIETDSLYADSLHLGGLLTVYEDEYSDDVGGYIGYDNGFNSAEGIGVRDSGGRSQMVCTTSAARLSFGDILYGISQVVCNQGSALVQGNSLITFNVSGLDRVYIDQHDGFYPADTDMTCGTELFPWGDVYAAGTSMSDLLTRVKALEDALGD